MAALARVSHYHALQTTIRERSLTATVVAVSKRQSPEAIAALYAAGCRNFGENYVQEWQQKRLALADTCPEIAWHFIGRLQRNKLADLVGRVALIHSLASLDHLKKIHALAEKTAITQTLLVQVNIGQEASKAGIAPDILQHFLQEAATYPRARIAGLMTFPAPTPHPETLRPVFAALRALRDRANAEHWYPIAPLTELSMGTSGDWKIALEEGATLLRLGTVVFGGEK